MYEGFMVRRNPLTRHSLYYWFGAPIAILAFAACSSFWTADPGKSNWSGTPNCPTKEDGSLAIPIECCPCPWNDMCPNGWPELPDHCRTGCEPGEPIECCMCPTEAWCTEEAGQTYKLPEWCKDKPWLDGGTSSICREGTCAPKTPEGWLGPAILAEGLDIHMPPCPKGMITWDGLAEPPPPGCTECACSTPESICGSAPHWTISSRSCGDFDNGVKWNFDPPADWDGSCNSEKSLPAGKLCGSEGYCVKSITISPPKLEQIDTSCTPFKMEGEPAPVPKLYNDAPVGIMGRVCIDKDSKGFPSCGVNDENVCVSLPGPSPICIAREGTHDCPAAWPERHIFFKRIDDQRSCSECSCGPVEGASCKRRYTLYTDNGCTTEFGSWLSEDTDLPQCLWLIDGMAIGSKTLETVEHELGSCKPLGGEVIGDVTGEDPFTVCCAPSNM